MKKLLAMLLALAMVLSLAACSTTPAGDANTPGDDSTTPAGPVIDVVEGDFTYRTYTTALGSCWNPHTWDTNGDSAIMGYIETPLVTMSIDDSLNGVYQWVYLAAESVTDVTADHQDDLTKYGVTLPEGQAVEETTSGFVFEIKLNPDMKWENGEPINADTYIYSMKALLDPAMKNYRANLYYAGESAVAGGDDFYYAGSSEWLDAASAYRMTDLVVAEDGSYTTPDGAPVMFAVVFPIEWLGGKTLADYVGTYGADMFDVASFEALAALADENGNVAINDETIDLLTKVITFSSDWGETEENLGDYLVYYAVYPECEYDGTVGCYKVDDYTIRYVTQTQIDINYFLTSCTSNWIVYEDLYEAGKDTTGALVTTNYGTSLETTMSYGPYKMESLQDAKQLVFVQNENWYNYQTTDSGYLYAVTDYLVDGEQVQQYQTTKVVIDVMDDDAAKQAFLKGELSDWVPSPDDLPTYATSEQMYKAPETHTMSFFFNTDVDALKAMDTSLGNTNSVVLSNINFRKAFSLAIDRDEFTGATAGYVPAYSMLNSLYYYDVYNDPTSSYRNSEPAMQAICNYYGVEYGEGTPYADLKAAYDSINGYNLTAAQELMKTACAELVEAGLYTEGDPIHIRIGWAKGAMTSSDNQQVALMQKYINQAAEGSGFGEITLEGIGNIPNRYDAVPAGEYAVGYGAWGGAAFYPFRNFQCYCDPDQYAINELGCWDPTTTMLTLTVEGEEVTKSWQEWSGCMVGSGDMANKSFETKLQILADMEEAYLKFVYRIPLCSTTICSMLSYQCNYYTPDYNIMYGFGGLELLTYNYTDAEWAEYVAAQGNQLNYE